MHRPEQEHSCPLRGLTLCDGQEVEDVALRGVRPCYCAALAGRPVGEDLDTAGELRYLRALSLSRAVQLEFQRSARLRREAAAARADGF